MEKNPFSVEYFEFLHNKYGETEEVQKYLNIFIVGSTIKN